jgi:hypothetical protein
VAKILLDKVNAVCVYHGRYGTVLKSEELLKKDIRRQLNLIVSVAGTQLPTVAMMCKNAVSSLEKL